MHTSDFLNTVFFFFTFSCMSVFYASTFGSVVKNLPANAGDPRDAASFPVLGRSAGEGNGNPLQYSCLENPMDGGAWQATVHVVTRVKHNLATKPPPLTINLLR